MSATAARPAARARARRVVRGCRAILSPARALISTRRAAIDATAAARSAPAAASPLHVRVALVRDGRGQLGHLGRDLDQLERDRDDPLDVLVRARGHERPVRLGVGVCQRLGPRSQLLGAADDLGAPLPVVRREPSGHRRQPGREREHDRGNRATARRGRPRGNGVEELLDARVEEARRAQPCARPRRCRR